MRILAPVLVAAVLFGTSTVPAMASTTVGKGQTVRGSAYYQFTSTVPGVFQFGVNLPARARNPLSQENVNFAPDTHSATTDDDPSCTGNYTLPTAPVAEAPDGRSSTLHDLGGLPPMRRRRHRPRYEA